MFTLNERENPLAVLAANAGSTFVQNQFRRKQEENRARSIEEGLSQINEESSPLDVFKAINSIHGLDPDERKQLANSYGQVMKTKQESAKQRENALKADQESQKEQQDLSTIEQVFGPTAAKLWQALPVGGRTEAFRAFSDPLMRGKSGKDIEDLLTGVASKHEMSSQKGAVEKEGLIFPPVKPPQDLRQKDLPGYRESRRKENIPEIKSATEKLNASKKEISYLQQLDRLNRSGKLPEGLGRIIINPSTGEPYKAAQLVGKVNPSTQLFLKTINDFTTKAKDSFGARVTNFDLERFMARLPGLINTPDGRKAIIHQMQVVNELDSLYEDALSKVFSHYGAGDITLEQAEDIARKNIEPTTRMLQNELGSIVESLDEEELEGSEELEQSLAGPSIDEFPPSQYNGKTVEDPETGIKYRSNGKKWVRV